MCLAGRADGLFMEASDRRECRSGLPAAGEQIFYYVDLERRNVSLVSQFVLFCSSLIRLSLFVPRPV